MDVTEPKLLVSPVEAIAKQEGEALTRQLLRRKFSKLSINMTHAAALYGRAVVYAEQVIITKNNLDM